MSKRRGRPATPPAPHDADGVALAPVDSPTAAALIEAAYAGAYNGSGEPDAVHSLLCRHVGVAPAVAARDRLDVLGMADPAVSQAFQAAGQRARYAPVVAA